MTKKPVGSKTQNRKPVSGQFDADGDFTPDELSQIESLLRVGAAALSQGKPLEESQQIGKTALYLIQRLKEPQRKKTEAAEP